MLHCIAIHLLNKDYLPYRMFQTDEKQMDLPFGTTDDLSIAYN